MDGIDCLSAVTGQGFAYRHAYFVPVFIYMILNTILFHECTPVTQLSGSLS